MFLSHKCNIVHVLRMVQVVVVVVMVVVVGGR
jgi:hypothetical protein